MAENRIREAAKLLSGHWHKGGLSDRRGNRCGIGWLQLAHRCSERSIADRHLYAVDLALMNEAALDKFPDRVKPPDPDMHGKYPFPEFNDHPLTCEREVVAVMELAADRWDVEFG